MSQGSEEVEQAVAQLLAADEDQLFQELGIRVSALPLHPLSVAGFAAEVSYSGVEMGTLDDIRALGKRLFRRWNRELHTLVCGGAAEDRADREEISRALGLGDAGFAAFLATLLVSSFGLAPAVASVIAVIAVKRFLRPTVDELCQAWGAGLA